MGLFSRQVLGVDFGHASVKLVGLTLDRQPSIVGFAEVPVDPKFLQKEGFEDPSVVGEAIRQGMRQALPRGIHTKEVYAAVSETLVFRKILELPPMESDEELEQVIRTQAAEYLPDSLDTVELDFQQLGKLSEAKLEQVMVVAVGKRVIQDYMAVFASTKLALHAVDPKPSAVGRAIVSPQEKEALILVDVGSETSSISIYGQRMIWVTGTVNLGEKTLLDPDTNQYYEKDKLPEKIKRLAGSLADELDHVVKFYANRTAKQGELKEIRLSGRGLQVEGLAQAIELEVGRKVVSGKPLISLPSGCDGRFYGALGSALYPLYETL